MSTFNELIDFTRSTTGTYLDSVVYGDEVVVNGDFSNGTTGWTTADCTLSISSGALAITSTSAATGQAMSSFPTVKGKTYALSFESKNGTGIQVDVILGSHVGSADLANTTNYTGTTFTITRTTFVATGDTTYIALRSFVTGSGQINYFDNASVKEVTGGQVSGTPLLRTAAINEPRLEYDASGNPLGLLIEEARTNLVTSSLFNTAYQDQSVTRVLNQSGAPDGTSTATKVLETAGTAFHRTFAVMFFSSGSTYTQSVYAKSIGGRALQFTLGSSAFGGIHVNFDLENGAVGSNVGYTSASITDAGNGWYRCVATATASQNYGTDSSIVSVTSPTSGRLESFTGDTSKGLLVFGHQVEAGAFPTSYIPTSGSTVTRAADFTSLPVERFHYKDSQGSVLVHFDTPNIQPQDRLIVIGTSTSYRVFDISYDGNLTNYSSAAGGLLVGSLTSPAKAAVAFQSAKEFVGVKDGGAINTATTTTAVTRPEKVYIGSWDTLNDRFPNGHIKSIQYYPKRLSNEELQLLTQPSASPTMNLTFDGQATSTLVEGLHD